jgi:hypothetical protein
MKAEASMPGASLIQAPTKGTCPICATLKDFQWTLAEATRPESNLRLCNYLGWAVARSRGKLSRSTPGESVTSVFLGMLKGSLVGKVASEECTLCHRVLEQEVTRLRELAQKLQSAMFAQWMKGQGTLCLEHARKIKEFVPLRSRTAINEIIERNRAELEQELESFLEQLRHGIHEGGGVLGRAAEFLVGQRGL